ncbi:MAG: 23S rRNA (guanosine(2251)-2'-O)-methyltransferase RlmB [Cyanobacteria bacterium]|nr:23S rRNA (guanosine(2251)-2'-O)-methyltransferase RlmB [Cyanobacteriota bacterium]
MPKRNKAKLKALGNKRANQDSWQRPPRSDRREGTKSDGKPRPRDDWEHEDRSPERSEGGDGRPEEPAVICGKNAVLAYLENMSHEDAEEGKDVNKIFVATGLTVDDRLRQIQKLSRELKLPLSEVPRSKLDGLTSGNHQGVVALLCPIKLLTMSDLIELIRADKEGMGVAEASGLQGYTIVALDGLEDPHNVGAIIRTAEASGARAVIIPDRRASQITETVAATSAGAIAHMTVVRVTNLVSAIETLKEEGFWAVGLAGEARESVYSFDWKRPVLLVVGSEGKGIRRLVRERCDALVSIPMRGKTQSLNASVATAVALYEIVRQNG